jgi:hypothetical protein
VEATDWDAVKEPPRKCEAAPLGRWFDIDMETRTEWRGGCLFAGKYATMTRA